MKQKKEYVKVRVIDPKHVNFGKVIDVYKMEDTRFFANRWGAKYGDKAYFGDQLDFNPDKPIPVMYNLTDDVRGPWSLGYAHPDDIKKITPKGDDYIKLDWEKSGVYIFDYQDGIPACPKYVMPLSKFKAPEFVPNWYWIYYCGNRKLAETENKKK